METSRKFLFQLCKELNYKSVAELEATMSSNELNEWVEFYTEEPFMAKVLEVQIATLTEMVIRSFAKEPNISAIDFMITVSQADKKAKKEEIKRKKLFDQLSNFGT